MNIESIVEDFYNVPNKLRKHKNQIKMNNTKTLHNIWDLEQLTNHNLKEIAFELDNILFSECVMNYNPMNKIDLVSSIYNTLLGENLSDMTDMIDYLIELVKDEQMTLTNH